MLKHQPSASSRTFSTLARKHCTKRTHRQNSPRRSAAVMPSALDGHHDAYVADGLVSIVQAKTAPRNTGATIRPPVPKFMRVISMT
jgi:hypothetical protein